MSKRQSRSAAFIGRFWSKGKPDTNAIGVREHQLALLTGWLESLDRDLCILESHSDRVLNASARDSQGRAALKSSLIDTGISARHASISAIRDRVSRTLVQASAMASRLRHNRNSALGQCLASLKLRAASQRDIAAQKARSAAPRVTALAGPAKEASARLAAVAIDPILAVAARAVASAFIAMLRLMSSEREQLIGPSSISPSFIPARKIDFVRACEAVDVVLKTPLPKQLSGYRKAELKVIRAQCIRDLTTLRKTIGTLTR